MMELVRGRTDLLSKLERHLARFRAIYRIRTCGVGRWKTMLLTSAA